MAIGVFVFEVFSGWKIVREGGVIGALAKCYQEQAQDSSRKRIASFLNMLRFTWYIVRSGTLSGVLYDSNRFAARDECLLDFGL